MNFLELLAQSIIDTSYETITINDDNIDPTSINKKVFKVRALIINDDNQVLLCNYGSALMLPGGKIDKNETKRTALKREIAEELGITYDDNEISAMVRVVSVLHNYPTREGNIENNVVETLYYLIKSNKTIDLTKTELTDKEKNSGFFVETVNMEDIENIIDNNDTSNPRSSFFNRELLEVISFYKNTYCSKRKQLKVN